MMQTTNLLHDTTRADAPFTGLDFGLSRNAVYAGNLGYAMYNSPITTE